MHKRINARTISLATLLALAGGATALGGGGQPDATLHIGIVDARPGETVLIPYAMETQEMVGAFEFRTTADGNVLNQVIWDGALFSNGWEGWDNAPNSTVVVSAACIFTQDQVAPGNHHLINIEITVPAGATPGDFISIEATDMMFANYDFEFGTVAVVNGGINVKVSADITGDGIVNAADIGMLLAQWGTQGSGDLDGDGTVSGADLGEMLSAWGTAG